MKSNLFLQVIIAILMLCDFSVVRAETLNTDKALEWAEDKGRLLLNTFQEQDTELRNRKLDDLFEEYVDVPYVAKFVVGRYWKEMDEPQRQEYLDIFKRYVKAVYKTFPLGFLSRISYEVTGAVPDKNFVVVNALIRINAEENAPIQEFLVAFRLRKNNGKIKLVDVKVAESSLLLSYRGKFYEMISSLDGEISWFLEDLTAMSISAEKINQRNLREI
ncbi:MAG: ABC transporter substrate-binding protein [Alphaproteobacteria bacterium]|nr:ABC transporter substrate-binding protein [Alphaproteobacteria bacterium]